jgi:2-polyprenyl-3-methyl-5-hydroxy-6-metoxy-1,4-benzoquinol methylase
MKWLDGFIRDLRIKQALPFIHDGDRLLDIGCFDQTLLNLVAPRVASAVGVDPLAAPARRGKITILQGTIPGSVVLEPASFDSITMLAVLEHIPNTAAVAAECVRLLAPGGRLIITVPKPQVDHILAVLGKLRLIDGMSLDEHHGYDVEQTQPIFERAGMTLARRKNFEFGLNCLFVFEKPAAKLQVETKAHPAPRPLAL